MSTRYPTPVPFTEKLAELVAANADNPTGCWVWPVAPEPDGYPKVRYGQGRRTRAHRAAYMVLVGPIPDGLVLDHLCRNHCCVNPAHLEAVTERVNILRGNGACAQHARKTHCKHGHPLRGNNLKIAKDGERQCITCRRQRSREWYARTRQERGEEHRAKQREYDRRRRAKKRAHSSGNVLAK